MKAKELPALAVLGMGLSPPPPLAFDGTQTETQRLVAADVRSTDEFGSAVDVDGDVLVIGAPSDDDVAFGAGAVYVFGRRGSLWVEEAKLTAAGDAASVGGFGAALDLDGEALLVGAPRDRARGFESGAAYVFVRVGGVWQEQSRLVASDTAARDLFGWSVALDGGVAAIGAFLHDSAGEDAGGAHVFERVGTSWFERAKVVPAGAAAGDHFGIAVALDGGLLVAGAPGHGRAGAAYGFRRDGRAWVEEGALVPDFERPARSFGSAVALSEGRLAVGDRDDSGAETRTGAAYVFVRRGTAWSQEAVVRPGLADNDDVFGGSIDLDGGRLVVGSMLGDAALRDAGAAYVYARRGTTWGRLATSMASDATRNVLFGAAVAVDGGRVVVGAPWHGHAGSLAGAAYAFDGFPTPLGVPYCFGGWFAGCPCLNGLAEGNGMGCRSSTGLGAELLARGSTSVAADDLTLLACFLAPGEPALLIAGDESVGARPFGDGLLCAGGVIARFGTRRAGPGGDALWGPGLARLGAWSAGETRFFQAWYRDPQASPCGSSFNLSSALELASTP